MNVIPYEDLTRKVCDWIFATIGTAAPPAGGAMFEIEAKLGEIRDAEDDARINLPVDTEAVFNKDKFRKTRFESTMNIVSVPAQRKLALSADYPLRRSTRKSMTS